MIALNSYLSRIGNPHNILILKMQWAQSTDSPTIPQINCRCGGQYPINDLFKCLYCGEYFCYPCAEKHFGKTREEWDAENGLPADGWKNGQPPPRPPRQYNIFELKDSVINPAIQLTLW